MAKKTRIRADAALVAQGLAKDLAQARALIMAGQAIAIEAPGKERKVEKAGLALPPQTTFRLKQKPKRGGYASRGGLKLERALDAFEIEVKDLICLDVGLSTGGFTDCLLKRGARRVHGVDVGRGDVDWRLRNDPRLVLHERTNARTLPPNAFGERAQLAVIDVSFISLRLILGPVRDQLTKEGRMIALVKPQFEAPKEAVVGGLVPRSEDREAAVQRVLESAEALGLNKRGQIESPIQGAEGNVEYLLLLGS